MTFRFTHALMVIFSITLLTASCSKKVAAPITHAESDAQVGQLVGIWKNQKSNQYEEWKAVGSIYMGRGYKITDGQQSDMEYLSLRKEGETWIYAARVPNQNEGRTIDFVQDRTKLPDLVFSNTEHDFPNHIRYHFVSSGQIKVYVRGNDGKGFDITMDKMEVK